MHLNKTLCLLFMVDQLNYENYRLETKNRSFLVIRLFMVLVLVKLPKGEEPMVPATADESFADFFYNFASDEKFQLSRIVFPLPYYTMEKKFSGLIPSKKYDFGLQ